MKMKLRDKPAVEPIDGLTRVLFQVTVDDEGLSWWFDQQLTGIQLMTLKTALELAHNRIGEVLEDEVFHNDEEE